MDVPGGHMGTVITTETSPSTCEFSFLITHKASKGQYVQTKNEDGLVLGYVSEIVRSNRYFERPDSVSEYEKKGSISQHFPANAWNYSVGEVKILGLYKDEKFMRVFAPPHPGEYVYLAEGELLKNFLGFVENGLCLGNVQHHEITAKIDMTRLLQKHLAIVAMSGAGKSHLTSVIIEELLDRKSEDGRIALIVIDIHGEYVGFKHDGHYGKQTIVIDAKDISFPLKKVRSEMFEEWLPLLSSPQKQLLRHSIYSLKKTFETEAYNFRDLIEEIENSETSKEDVKRSLKRPIMELYRYKFLSKNKETPYLIKDIVPGRLLILDFSSIDNLHKKQILVSLITRRLFKLRRKAKIPPFLLIVEEAHNFAREKAEAYEAVSRPVIETIAREGRKFGASLCLISQRPVNLSSTALSQCNTHIILRVTNPNDLDHIQMSSEGIDSKVVKNITHLRVGESIVVGEAVNSPLFLQVRKRKFLHKEKNTALHDQAIEFEKSTDLKSQQVEAFL